MPIYDGLATLNLFVGVTDKDLKLAKQSDIYEVAQKLFDNGYLNYAPSIRESVV